MRDHDELDDATVRERLRALRRQTARQALHDLGMTPLAEGQTPPPANRHIDAFGRGPSSPLYQPDFRPPWAPDWTPSDGPVYPRWAEAWRDPNEDDGIEWRLR